MKHSLPILPAIVLGGLAAIIAGVVLTHTRGQKRVDSTAAQAARPVVAVAAQGGAGEGAVRPGSAPAPNPGDLIRQASAQLAAHDSIAATISLSTDLFENRLVLQGHYLQGKHDSRRFRLELKMQLGDTACSLQQVSDGHWAWTRRTTLRESYLGRIDVRRARASLQHAGFPVLETLSLGGVPLLLDSLYSALDFNTLHTEESLHQPVIVLSGVWKRSLLAQLMPEQRQAIETGGAPDLKALPQHLPNQVDVFLGRDDLFPYKIEFLRAAHPGARDDDDRVLASMKFVDVQFDVRIDPSQFVFQPGEAVPVDETDAFVARMMSRERAQK